MRRTISKNEIINSLHMEEIYMKSNRKIFKGENVEQIEPIFKDDSPPQDLNKMDMYLEKDEKEKKKAAILDIVDSILSFFQD